MANNPPAVMLPYESAPDAAPVTRLTPPSRLYDTSKPLRQSIILLHSVSMLYLSTLVRDFAEHCLRYTSPDEIAYRPRLVKERSSKQRECNPNNPVVRRSLSSWLRQPCSSLIHDPYRKSLLLSIMTSTIQAFHIPTSTFIFTLCYP